MGGVITGKHATQIGPDGPVLRTKDLELEIVQGGFCQGDVNRGRGCENDFLGIGLYVADSTGKEKQRRERRITTAEESHCHQSIRFASLFPVNVIGLFIQRGTYRYES